MRVGGAIGGLGLGHMAVRAGKAHLLMVAVLEEFQFGASVREIQHRINFGIKHGNPYHAGANRCFSNWIRLVILFHGTKHLFGLEAILVLIDTLVRILKIGRAGEHGVALTAYIVLLGEQCLGARGSGITIGVATLYFTFARIAYVAIGAIGPFHLVVRGVFVKNRLALLIINRLEVLTGMTGGASHCCILPAKRLLTRPRKGVIGVGHLRFHIAVSLIGISSYPLSERLFGHLLRSSGLLLRLLLLNRLLRGTCVRRLSLGCAAKAADQRHSRHHRTGKGDFSRFYGFHRFLLSSVVRTMQPSNLLRTILEEAQP